MTGLRHISEFLVCPVIFECGEDDASCDCAWHENMRAAEASHEEQKPEPETHGWPPDDQSKHDIEKDLRHTFEKIKQPKCYECGFPATVRLIRWYCDTCYASLNETHKED